MNIPLYLAFIPSGMQLFVIALIGLLLFGKRLPEVGRSLGKGIIEFKKGLRGIEDEFDFSSTGSSKPSRRSEDWADTPSTSAYSEASVPKFEPPTTAPVPKMEY